MSVHLPASGIGRELMNLAPPGIDELFGMLSVVDARADYDVIVVDTAPTGHALRLLEMPDAAREWVQVLLRVLLKYRSLVRPGQLAAELVDVSKSIRELQVLLRDNSADAVHCRHARGGGPAARNRAAADAASPPASVHPGGRRQRADDVAWALRALPRHGRGRSGASSPHCDARRGCVIIRTPLSAPPPRGVKALERWAGLWIGEGRAKG